MFNAKPTVIFSQKAATGTGTAYKALEFERVVFQLATSDNANFTIKFQMSNSFTQPDFSSSASATNQWEYVDVIAAADGSSIDGATGVSSAGTDIFRNYELNFGIAKWVCATITAHSAGKITLSAMGMNYK